jgi:Arc/MetJ-type ribon-helix-helix transcriptional regulator
MPEKKKRLTQAEQSKRVREKARELIDAGELNRTDSDNMLDRMVRKSIKDHGA